MKKNGSCERFSQLAFCGSTNTFLLLSAETYYTCCFFSSLFQGCMLRVTHTLVFANPCAVLKILAVCEIFNSPWWEMPPYILENPPFSPDGGGMSHTVYLPRSRLPVAVRGRRSHFCQFCANRRRSQFCYSLLISLEVPKVSSTSAKQMLERFVDELSETPKDKRRYHNVPYISYILPGTWYTSMYVKVFYHSSIPGTHNTHKYMI